MSKLNLKSKFHLKRSVSKSSQNYRSHTKEFQKHLFLNPEFVYFLSYTSVLNIFYSVYSATVTAKEVVS